HTSVSASFTRLTSRNLQSIEMGKRARHALDLGLDAVTIGTAWSRVEAGEHFPSDTLASIAIGNFIASFVNDAFLGGTGNQQAGVEVAASGGRAVVRWRISF
ncbi:MAG TPA: hypothetical protein VE175_05660, partial [Woeseiaceae bacterium]|nr:hypothetical protein [Woeseiaceae bacterium]